MATTRNVFTRVQPDIYQQVVRIAEQRGLIHPSGEPNVSAATRVALNAGLSALARELRRGGRQHDSDHS